MTEKHRFVLEHLVVLLREETETSPPQSKAETDFERGVAFGLQRSGTLLLECLRVFDVPPESVGADGFDPDRLFG